MLDVSFVNAGYNVAEFQHLKFNWSISQHAFFYFQGPVSVNGKRHDSGACILYPKGVKHDYETLDGFVNSYVGFLAPESIFSDLSIKTSRVFYPSNCDEINEIIAQICDEVASKRFGYEEECSALVIRLLVAISRGTRSDIMKIKEDDVKADLIKIREEYLKNVVEPKDIDSLILEANLSRTQFYSFYKKFFGVSPREDLIWARLNKARELIRENPDIKICNIAQMCGFSDTPYFLRQFKQRYGYTPKNYALACKSNTTGD